MKYIKHKPGSLGVDLKATIEKAIEKTVTGLGCGMAIGRFGNSKASSVYHEWLKDGDLNRVGNYNQILINYVAISGTIDGILSGTAAANNLENELSYQTTKGVTELYRDLNHAILNNTQSCNGANTTGVRIMGGLPAFVSERVEGKNIQEAIDNASPTKTGDILIIHPKNYKELESKSKVNAHAEGSAVNITDPLLEIVIDWDMPEGVAYRVNPMDVSIAWLRPVHSRDVISEGDRTRFIFVMEATLRVSGAVTKITITEPSIEDKINDILIKAWDIDAEINGAKIGMNPHTYYEFDKEIRKGSPVMRSPNLDGKTITNSIVMYESDFGTIIIVQDESLKDGELYLDMPRRYK